jgi:hypothetical protein
MHEWKQGLQDKDVDLLAKTLHKDFRYVSHPRSLGIPEQNKDQWLGQFAANIGLFTDSLEVNVWNFLLSLWLTPLQSTTYSIIDAPGRVVIHVRIPNTRIARSHCISLILYVP